VRRVIDLVRRERAINNGSLMVGASKAFQEYNLALTRGLASGGFLRWCEVTN